MLASNPANIRYNGTGRTYINDVGADGPGIELGELDGLKFAISVNSEKLKSTRTAARATILEVETERDASLSFGLREMSEENLKMALMGSNVNTQNQAAGTIFQGTPSYADDVFIDLGHLNVFVTKLSGTMGTPPSVGGTVTGSVSSASGKVAYVGADFLILVEVSGTFQVGEEAGGLTVSGIEKLEDVCVTDSGGSTLRASGTDYTVDPDYGYFRKMSSGSMAGDDVISYDYEAVERKYIWGLSASSVEKKLIFVADKDDLGPRQRWTFHKVKIALNGDFPLIGEGAAILQVSGSVLADTSQPTGQEYYKVEMM